MLVKIIDNFNLSGFLSVDMPRLPEAYYIHMSLMKKLLNTLY